MSTKTIAPYGEWESPITAAMLAQAGRPLSFAAPVGDQVWWAEIRPDQGGRTAVMTTTADQIVSELLPEPWNARSRVHEYGGLSWLGVPVSDAGGPASAGDAGGTSDTGGAGGPGGTSDAGGTGSGHALVFVHFDDQRIYRLDPGADVPVPLTPEPGEPTALRYADLVLAPSGNEVLAVRERHAGPAVERHIVAVPLDGSQVVREIVGGSHFLAYPRLSPDGRRLAWLAWDHPNMPWDGTELRVGAVSADGTVKDFQRVLGGPAEAVLQPEWADDDSLYALSDRTGWWNLYRSPSGGGEPRALHTADVEFGGPLWVLGQRWYALLPDGRLLTTRSVDSGGLGILDPESGELTGFDLPYQHFLATVSVSGSTAALVAGGPATPMSVIRLDTATGRHDVVRPALDPELLPDAGYLPTVESTTLRSPSGRDVHVHIYRPANPEFTGPDTDKPPYVVFVHGGPTSNSPAVLSGLDKAYFTSRGIGVLDVNYGGSTGYGREYRERLRGQWGVVDVEDCAIAAQALVDRGDADPRRLAIRGGSAGGWTTLCAVTRTDVFAAGMSLCGVTDVRMFNEITHDFESRYLDSLVGPFPEAAELAAERSPLTHANQTRCPVLLLQGAEDPIVPLSQAEVFRDALVAKGLRHALIVFEGEQHGFRKAESIVAAAEAELSFYGQVMGFTPPGVPQVELTP